MLKVLVSDKLSPDGLAILEKAGDAIALDVKVGLSPDDLKKIIGEYEGIIIRSATKLTADVLAEAKKLKAVIRAGVGVDNVDLKFAKEKGIAVMNTPGGSTSAVAELALGLMLALARRIPEADASMKAGKWDKKNLEGTQLKDKILGIIGFGRIGRQLATYAQAFGMTVLAYDVIAPKPMAGVQIVSLDEIITKADYISLHVPLTPETRNIIGEKTLPRMKKNVRIINCARGGTVDEAAVLKAVEAGQIAGAALDVFTKEPPEDFSVVKNAKIIATPHLGASTEEAQSSVSSEAAEIMVHLAKTGEYQNRLV